MALIPYAHEIAETQSLKVIHTLNLVGVGAFALCMVSYLVVINAALMSRYGKHIIQQRIDALIKASRASIGKHFAATAVMLLMEEGVSGELRSTSHCR